MREDPIGYTCRYITFWAIVEGRKILKQEALYCLEREEAILGDIGEFRDDPMYYIWGKKQTR